LYRRPTPWSDNDLAAVTQTLMLYPRYESYVSKDMCASSFRYRPHRQGEMRNWRAALKRSQGKSGPMSWPRTAINDGPSIKSLCLTALLRTTGAQSTPTIASMPHFAVAVD
jgi:hypothetical protein